MIPYTRNSLRKICPHNAAKFGVWNTLNASASSSSSGNFVSSFIWSTIHWRTFSMYTGAETETAIAFLPEPSDHRYSTPDGKPSPGLNDSR